MERMGIMHERYPRASPWMMLIAAPETQALARLLVGPCAFEVK